jgi:ABC-type polysaccharide/polyol phosphate export permease
MVAAMGPLYGALLNQPIGPYLRYLSVGLVIWTFLSGYLNDVCFAFISSAGLIKEVKIPFSTYVAKVLAKHVIVFGHNLVIIIFVLFLFPPPSSASAPLAAIGLLVILLNVFGVGLILAILGARFRDIPQIVGSFIQVLFFITPVMWQVSMLGNNERYADWNIVYHFIQIVRAPLLGETIASLSWIVTCGTCAVVIPLSFYLFARFRSRISYWV